MSRPNFLIIMSDEHDPRVSTPYGDSIVRTPRMQGLADTGALFESAYCNSPLCVPSRASFMTGKHLYRTEAWDNSVALRTGDPTWAHRLNGAGYETCLAGKMHFVGPDQHHGFKRRIMPDIHGMGGIGRNLPDWTTGAPLGGRNMRSRLMEEPGPGDHEHMQYDEEVTRRCVSYLTEPARKEQPWALCVGLFAPHFPFIARPEYYYDYYPKVELPEIPEGHLERLHPQMQNVRAYFDCADIPEEQMRKARAAYYGLVEFLDGQVGEIVDALDSVGLAEDTVVIYVADHGESLGEHGLWYKCSFYEPSCRIPLIVRWPGQIEPSARHGRATSLLDVVATMLDLADADAEFTDGASLAPLLAGTEADGEGLALAEYEGHGVNTPARMVRRGRHKLNHYHGEQPELYDLESDPGEFENLASDPHHAATVRELSDIATEGWDGESIREQVLRSQRERRIVAMGRDGPWSPPWRNGNYG